MQQLAVGKPVEQGYKGFNNLTIAKYRFRLAVTGKIVLPADKGSALHGSLGHALKRIAPA